MKVSLNSVKEFTRIDLSANELLDKINAQLGAVEEVIDFGSRYKGAVIARVDKCEKHQNADRLSVCQIDAGLEKTIQVVCGAPNVREGMFVVWLKPGSTVPASITDTEPFVLGERELRGVMSRGMLASPKELGFGDSHDGILEITEVDLLQGTSLQNIVGKSFAEVFGLDDTIIDIENKMFTHRPDCFGQLGVARELAGIQHKKFTSPGWYSSTPEFKSGDGLELKVSNGAPTVVPRFMAVAIKNVAVKSSPIWLQAALVRLGSKPINNIVDVTNYLMLLTGQPLHAYDYDLLVGQELGTRFAAKGEKTTLLNGKTYQLDETDIVIVDGEKVIGLGGVMGGGNSEVSEHTKNIVLECANFDMYAVRKSSMRHGLFTDAVTRFNKGQSPLQNEYVLSLAMQTIDDVAGGELASQVYDAHGAQKLVPPKAVSTTLLFINQRLGLSLTTKQVASLLTNVEFDVEEKKAGKDTGLKVTVPFWRTDIELPEDIVEEVGRLYGFEKLPRELPARSITPTPKNSRLVLKQAIRETLAALGTNEVLTYSFVHERVMKAAEQNPKDAFRLSNALSPDLQYYRLSVLPSLLDKVHGNIKSGFDEFVLFEIGKGHHKQSLSDDGLPNEIDLLEVVYTNKTAKPGAPYYQAQRYVTELSKKLGLSICLEPIKKTSLHAGMAPYDQSRSAYVKLISGAVIGTVGELKTSVRKNFKLPAYTAAFTIDIASLLTAVEQVGPQYQPLSRFPSVWQDISLKVETDLRYAKLHETIVAAQQKAAKQDWRVEISPLAIYQDPKDTASKTISFRFRVTSFSGTLTDSEVTKLLDTIAAATAKLGATRI